MKIYRLMKKIQTIFPIFLLLMLISAAATVLMWMGDMPKQGKAAEVVYTSRKQSQKIFSQRRERRNDHDDLIKSGIHDSY